MAMYRAYVNRKLDAKRRGGEHVRFEDVEASDRKEAESKVKLKRNEEVGDVVQLAPVQEMSG